MNTATATPKRPSAETLARLRRQMQRAGVTQKAVAVDLGVSHFHVCHVLGGRDVSAPVIRRAKEMIAEARNGVAAA